MLPRFSVASTKRCKDAASPGNGDYRGDRGRRSARRVIAGESRRAWLEGALVSFSEAGEFLVAMDRGLHASAVESRPVCYADIRLGVVVDVLLDDRLQRVLGFDVLCGDRAHRYLPLAACEVGEARIFVSSALVLMRQELDFYRERGRALTAVLGHEHNDTDAIASVGMSPFDVSRAYLESLSESIALVHELTGSRPS